MKRLARWQRRIRVILAVTTCGCMMETGCLQSDIAKRFRSATESGLVSGLSSAVTDPANAETGLRQAAAALLDGLGAILTPRTPANTGINQSTGGRPSSRN